MGETTLRLTTTGMHCASCSMLIDMSLADLEGVKSSVSDHAAGTTVVVYDPSVTDMDTIIGTIRGLGYDATPAP